MEKEHFEQCKKEMIRRKTYPYIFHNERLAREFWGLLIQEVPTARLYIIEEIGQAVTYDQRAEKRLCEKIIWHEDQHKRALLKLHDAMMEVRDSIVKNDTKLNKK